MVRMARQVVLQLEWAIVVASRRSLVTFQSVFLGLITDRRVMEYMVNDEPPEGYLNRSVCLKQ